MWQLWFRCYSLDLSLYDCCFNHNVNRHFFKKPKNLGVRREDTEHTGKWWHNELRLVPFSSLRKSRVAPLNGGFGHHPDASKQLDADRLTLTGPGTFELQWMDAR